MADESRVPVQRFGFQLEEMEDESLLYHDKMKKSIYLNVSATVIWKLCDGTRSIKEIIALLNGAYAESGVDVAGDVEATVEKLASEHAIRFESPPERQLRSSPAPS